MSAAGETEAPPRHAAPWLRDAVAIAILGLVARLAVAAWAATRFPPAADGTYYQRIAERIAQGFGYTWLWPDGAVTYAAHYPVGYPAMLAAIYAVTGAHPWAAMRLNAILGALAVFAVHRLAARAGTRRVAAIAGLLVALHPGLVAYTPAIMTEGVTASLLACAAAIAAWASDRAAGRGFLARVAALGLVLGVATLVRPQSIVLAPILAVLAAIGGAREGEGAPRAIDWRRVALAASIASAAAFAVCAPWTARNCVRMKRCALVSVNGGWNLLIGADPESTGAWSQIKTPPACREVWDEAEKDACFGREARRYIAEHPATWLALAPRKLAATFDYAGAAPWYLHASNPKELSYRAKVVLGGVETFYERVVLLLALCWAARAREEGTPSEPKPLRWARAAIAIASGLAAFTLHAWIAYAAFAVVALLRGRALLRGPLLPSAAVAVVIATIATHAVFFGAGRYSLVVFPLLSGVAALALPRRWREGRGAKGEASTTAAG